MWGCHEPGNKHTTKEGIRYVKEHSKGPFKAPYDPITVEEARAAIANAPAADADTDVR